MATIQLEAQVSSDELLKAVGQLNTDELEDFMQRVLQLRAQRQVKNLPQAETELLQKINLALPEEVLKRFHALDAQRREHTLTQEEHTELLDLIQRVEAFNVRRIEALVALAQLRQTSLKALMKKLGIKAPEYA